MSENSDPCLGLIASLDTSGAKQLVCFETRWAFFPGCTLITGDSEEGKEAGAPIESE